MVREYLMPRSHIVQAKIELSTVALSSRKMSPSSTVSC